MKNNFEDEINFADMIKNPIRFFGVIYPYFIITIIAGGIFWVYNFEFAYKNTVKAVKLKRDTIVPELEMKKGSSVPGIDLALITNATPAMIENGKAIFSTNCGSCHGIEGKGDGPASAALNPKPRNFTSKDGWKNGMKFGDMFKTLNDGIPGSGMVSYAHLSINDRIALIHFIKSTFMKDETKPSADEITQLDQTYNLTKGTVTPNQIPVKLAMAKLLEENKKSVDQNSLIAKSIDDDNSENALIVKNYIYKTKKAVSFLTKNNKWRASSSEFLTLLRNSFPNNGICVKLLKADNNEISTVYSYLLNVIPQANLAEVKN